MTNEYYLVPKVWIDTVITLSKDSVSKMDGGNVEQFAMTAARLVGQCSSAESIITNQHHYEQHLETLKEMSNESTN